MKGAPSVWSILPIYSSNEPLRNPWLKSKYTFYSIKPFSQAIEEFVKQNFYLLHGKIYNKPDGTLILALENGYLENDGLLEKLRKVSHVTIFH